MRAVANPTGIRGSCLLRRSIMGLLGRGMGSIAGVDVPGRPADVGNDRSWADALREEPDRPVAEEEIRASRMEAIEPEVVIAVDGARAPGAAVRPVGGAALEDGLAGGGVGPPAAVPVRPRVGGRAEV